MQYLSNYQYFNTNILYGIEKTCTQFVWACENPFLNTHM